MKLYGKMVLLWHMDAEVDKEVNKKDLNDDFDKEVWMHHDIGVTLARKLSGAVLLAGGGGVVAPGKRKWPSPTLARAFLPLFL